MPELRAGTSGFAYPQWKPAFYPAKLPQKQFLEHYANRLNTVEINYTFRRNPSSTTVENWIRATPREFRFCLKAHMRITHILRLRDAREATKFFLRSVDPLRVNQRLGIILFQLPPSFRRDLPVLTEFLEGLPADIRFAFEFRHTSWHQQDVYDVLQKHKACFCLAESDTIEPPEVTTADFLYFRLRKPEYSAEDRTAIFAKAQEYVSANKDVYLFFKHEDTPEGAHYAEDLLARARSRPK